MNSDYTGILIRIFPLDEERACYPVEAEIDDGSRFQDGELRLDLTQLLRFELDQQAYGMALFGALFTGETQKAYEKAAAIAETDTGGRLRVRLWVDKGAVELHAVRWECLYHLQKGQPVPLAASALTPFSRYTSLAVKEPEPVTEEPLNMLVVLSNPREGPEGMAPVNMAAEVENLQRSILGLIKAKKLKVSLMPGMTGLDAALRARLGEDGFTVVDGPSNLFTIAPHLVNTHIFHFIGHGGYRRGKEEQEGQAALHLEKADGTWQASVDDEIVSMFAALGTLPHCVFLQSCETARRETNAGSPFVGLGPKLVQAGIPAVVAMQRPVPMGLARLFTAEFYTRLAEHGQVDLALNQARMVAFNEKRAEWSIPVLFMRIRSGRLFGREPQEELAGERENPQVSWNSGDISGSQINFGDGNVMIQGTGNKVVHSPSAGLSRAELKELRAGFADLRTQIEAAAPPEKKEEALHKADQLQEAVLGKKPNPSKMASVRDWFIENAPGVADAVTGMVVNPIVGRLVGAAGDLVAGEFRRLFGDTG